MHWQQFQHVREKLCVQWMVLCRSCVDSISVRFTRVGIHINFLWVQNQSSGYTQSLQFEKTSRATFSFNIKIFLPWGLPPSCSYSSVTTLLRWYLQFTSVFILGTQQLHIVWRRCHGFSSSPCHTVDTLLYSQLSFNCCWRNTRCQMITPNSLRSVKGFLWNDAVSLSQNKGQTTCRPCLPSIHVLTVST